MREYIQAWISCLTVFAVTAVCSVFYSVVYSPAPTLGPSMMPNIGDGPNWVIGDHLIYFFFKPQRGDIVSFVHSSQEGKEILIKRVIGLPGETVEIRGGVVYINGHQLKEPYQLFGDNRSYAPIRVAPEHYFVLGDNRPQSYDSRYFGPVSRDKIEARVFLVLWPPSHWAWLGWPVDYGYR